MVSEPTPTTSVVAGELSSLTFSLPVLALAQVMVSAKVCGSGDGGGHTPASLTIGAVVVPLLTCCRLVVVPLGAANPVTLTGPLQPAGSVSLFAVSTPAATVTLGVAAMAPVWAWATPASPKTPTTAVQTPTAIVRTLRILFLLADVGEHASRLCLQPSSTVVPAGHQFHIGAWKSIVI